MVKNGSQTTQASTAPLENAKDASGAPSAAISISVMLNPADSSAAMTTLRELEPRATATRFPFRSAIWRMGDPSFTKIPSACGAVGCAAT